MDSSCGIQYVYRWVLRTQVRTVCALQVTMATDFESAGVGFINTGASTIDQRLVFVGREDGKLLAIRQIIQEGLSRSCLKIDIYFLRAQSVRKYNYHH